MNPDQTTKILDLLEPFELRDRNGNYQRLACQRMQGMADILGIPVAELTLTQAIECIEAASTEHQAQAIECRELIARSAA